MKQIDFRDMKPGMTVVINNNDIEYVVKEFSYYSSTSSRLSAKAFSKENEGCYIWIHQSDYICLVEEEYLAPFKEGDVVYMDSGVQPQKGIFLEMTNQDTAKVYWYHTDKVKITKLDDITNKRPFCVGDKVVTTKVIYKRDTETCIFDLSVGAEMEIVYISKDYYLIENIYGEVWLAKENQIKLLQ